MEAQQGSFFGQGGTMPGYQHRDASFVVRIWWEQRPGAEPLWRGQVIHTATNQARYFERVEDLVVFVQNWTGISPSLEPGLRAEERTSRV
jgi:hypothetical protein